MPSSHLLALLYPVVVGVCLAGAGRSWAQDTIYRCGNEYTNDVTDAKAKGCKVVIGGNVTVIQAPKAAPVATPRSNPGINVGLARVESFEQRQRDADARTILEAELRKNEQKLEQLRREYNDGQPEKLAPETKNYQKYLDRVTEMRNQITRVENDVASVKRELARLSGKTPVPASSPQ
jgi:hypothetical protein